MKEKSCKNQKYLHTWEFVPLARVGVSRRVMF